MILIIWRRCFEERIVEVCCRGLNKCTHCSRQAHTEITLSVFIMAGPRTQRKTKEIVKTFKDHGPHRRNNKSECQECTCKIHKSLNRRMCIKFESRKICVAGNQCDKSDFDFHNAEHKELPVIKIFSDEGREDCQQLKLKGTQAF